MAHPKRKRSEQDHIGYAHEEPRDAEIVQMPLLQQPDYTPEPQPSFQRIGDILRRERERRGDDLQQIADHLCIRRGFLAAIENSKYDEFPADIYVIGFLRSYAQYLGLDGQEVIDYYHHEMEGRRKKPALVLPVPISEGRTPSIFVLVGAAVAALIIYIAWYGLSTSDRAKVITPPALPVTSPAAPPTVKTTPEASITPTATVAPLPEATVMTPAAPAATNPETTVTTPSAAPVSLLPPAPSAPVAAKAAPAPVAAKDSRIMIKAEQASWVLVADSKGHMLYDNIMKPGEAYAVPNQPGLTLTTGNGAGIVITVDGKDIPKLSNTSSMTRNMPLNADALKQPGAKTP